MNETTLNQSLGEFLRARRERLTPEEVGLPSYGYRRTPGLRREEVAQLAHIGVSWYTSLEQGRNVHPSDQVLDNLASALNLSPVERRHLFLLSKQDGMEEIGTFEEVSTGLERTVLALEPHPAYIMGKYWDLLLWNRAAEFVFRFPPYSKDVNSKPNLIRRYLSDPVIRETSSNWEENVQVMIARFRADCARYPQDAKLIGLIEEFKQTSEHFRKYWPRHDVQTVSDCHKLWDHPLIGKMEFEHVTLQVPTQPNLKVMIYTASPTTFKQLEEMLCT